MIYEDIASSTEHKVMVMGVGCLDIKLQVTIKKGLGRTGQYKGDTKFHQAGVGKDQPQETY